MGSLREGGQRVREDRVPGAGWAGYLLQLDEGELHVCALGDLLLIPGRGEGARQQKEKERGHLAAGGRSLGYD